MMLWNHSKTSLSIRMVIRVLPDGKGSSAPRLPFEKSYSFFICSPLVFFSFSRSCLACCNNTNAFPSPGVNNDQDPPLCIHAQPHEPFLIRVLVFDRQCAFVLENNDGLRKTNPVLSKIRCGFFRIPFIVHTHDDMHICTSCQLQVCGKEGNEVRITLQLSCGRSGRAFTPRAIEKA